MVAEKILIVTADVQLAASCREWLAGAGYLPSLCSNPAEALHFAGETGYSLAVVDEAFAEAGIDFFPRLRTNRPELAGVLLSAANDAERVVAAVNSGFTRVCSKPLVAADLLAAVAAIGEESRVRADSIRLQTLLPLYDYGRKFLLAQSEQAVCADLIDAVGQVVPVTAVSVMLYDKATGSLRVVASRGLDERFLENLQIQPGERIAGRVFQSGHPVLLNRDSRPASPFGRLMERSEIATAISLPIVGREAMLGVVNVSNTVEGAHFDEAEVEMLTILAGQAMLAIENLRVIREREEQSRMLALLGQYVSPEVSTLLMESGEEMMTAGSVQDLTVLFADIRNFTLLVQQLATRELRRFLNSFFDLFTTVVFARRGMLDKFMGDGALVIFGAPVEIANPDDAAVQAAVEVMTGFARLQSQAVADSPVFARIGLGIGISRGPVFLGNIGSPRRLDYTVVGTDVNIAQRLGSSAASGQILITDSVCRRLHLPLRFEGSNKMLLRGLVSEVVVHSLSILAAGEGGQG